MSQVLFNVYIYAKQKINLTWPNVQALIKEYHIQRY